VTGRHDNVGRCSITSPLRPRAQGTGQGRSGFARRTALISAVDLDGNGFEQPVKLGVVQVFERSREVAWEGNTRRRCADR